MIVGGRHAGDKPVSPAWRPPWSCVVLLLLISATQADYQAGLDAYQHGDFDRAIVEWQAVVESPPGTVSPAIRAETLYAVGMLFWLGQGVQQDTRESASWLQLAADMNHAGAQTKLGFLYSTGQGVRQSNFEAFKWFNMAANQGDADAQYNLAVLYRDGLGVGSDTAQAMKWFREAAANGDPISAGIVANFEQSGVLIRVDGSEARIATAESSQPAIPAVESSPSPDIDEKAVGGRSSGPQQAVDSGEGWIRQREPEHYTIQVIALSRPEKLHDFIGQHQDWSPFAIYRQGRYEQPLWVLVQGDYPDVSAARLALANFPENIQTRDKLWIRRFVMVQGLLE